MKPGSFAARWSAVSLVMIIFSGLFINASIFDAQENVPLTTFQLIARSDLVVQARVLDGNDRLAAVEVIETIRGESTAMQLRIDFRELNMQRRGQEVVLFNAGEEYIFLLERPDWRKPSEKNRDIFALFHGRRGRIALPAEGGGVQVEAIEKLAALVGKTPEDQLAGLRLLVASVNPMLRESALEELARLRAARVDDLPTLSRLLQDPNPSIRAASLDLISGVMPLPADGVGDAEKRIVLEMCRERARNDPAEFVRLSAVRALGSWTVREEIVADLKAISTGDPAQTVRYEALRILYSWGMTGSGRHP